MNWAARKSVRRSSSRRCARSAGVSGSWRRACARGDEELDALLLRVPNIPDETAPVGADESANVTVKTVGQPPEFDFEPKPHWDIAESLGIADFERGVRLAGSRFFVLRGKGAKLQRALISFMIDMHVDQHGYTEVYLPYMVNSDTVLASGHLPGFREEM